MIFRVKCFYLREQCCKPELLVSSGHDFDDCNFVLFMQLLEKSIKKLRRTSHMFFIRIDEIRCSNIMIGFNKRPRLETNQSNTRFFNTFNFIHFISSYPYFFTSKRIIGSYLLIEKSLSLIINLPYHPFQRFISSCINLLS